MLRRMSEHTHSVIRTIRLYAKSMLFGGDMHIDNGEIYRKVKVWLLECPWYG